jgi:uncharacterized protein with NAD-binding domain and iron-sulfur cluster
MRSEGRQKIVIIGGGPAGLAAAFELTKPGLCPGDCVTVYQIGWRLGGKCASGRDERGRIVEHGLHLWFGYYENAFRLLREVYEELPDKPRRFRRWSDAFQPQKSTQIGDHRHRKDGRFIPFFWPSSEGSPGDGRQPQFWHSLVGVLKILSQVHDAFAEKARHGTVSIHPEQAQAFDSLFLTQGALESVSPRDAIRCALQWSTKIRPGLSDPIHLIGLKALLRDAAVAVSGKSRRDALPMTVEDKLLSEVTDIAAAFFSGIIDDVVFRRMEVVELDESDFCDWLIANGADSSTVNNSPFVSALYDMMFQYCEGQTGRPSYGAGTAAQVVLRILGTYKGDAVWKANAGLGEVLIAPLYEVLKARGVRFAFFHKLEKIELTEDRAAVAQLRFSRQIDLPQEGFEPTFAYKGLTCWPETPPPNLMQRSDVSPDDNFESRWCNSSVKPDVVLNEGSDFSDVILAIPLGAFKRLGGDMGPCDELVRASPRFRAMTENIGLIPSLSVQVWSSKSPAELGWTEPTTAMVSGPRALQIWADMSQVLECEPVTKDGPKSLHYFCNVFGSHAYRDPKAVGAARDAVRALTIDWFEKKAREFWPKATGAAQKAYADFDWNTFEDSLDRNGVGRLDAQVVKANVDPLACCCGSAAGSTGWRLKTDASGFRHLFLAGAWIDTGFNTECVEAAVMSGKQASRAICGSPAVVEGEHFMRPGKPTGLSAFNLARDALAVLASIQSRGGADGPG